MLTGVTYLSKNDNIIIDHELNFTGKFFSTHYYTLTYIGIYIVTRHMIQ